MKRILFLLFTLLMITGCGKDDESDSEKPIDKKDIEVTAVSIDNKKDLMLNAGESYKLTASYSPANATKPTFSWSISDSRYDYMTKSIHDGAFISNDGTITSGKGGRVTVCLYATTSGGKELMDQCNVRFTPSAQEFYEFECYGFTIEDTTGFRSGKFVLFKPKILSENDTTYLVGLKDEKIWIGTFDTKSKKMLDEWTDTEKTSRIQKIHLGYGKYEEFTINNAEVKSYIKDGENVIMELAFGSGEIGASNSFTMLSFKKDHKTNRYFVDNVSQKPLIEWYDNSYLFNIDARKEPYNQGDYYTCFDERGNIIITGTMFQWHNAERLHPISFDEYLYFDYGYKSIHISKKSISNGKDLWSKILMDDFDTDSKFTLNLISKEGSVFRFSIDIIEYSGNKYSVIYDINIIDGSFEKIIN